jgi:filamentous hemagglutinin
MGVGEEARADACIILEGVTTTVRQSTSTESSPLVWQRLTDRGSVTETAMALPSFVGGVAFSTPGGLSSVQVPQSASACRSRTGT